MTGVRRVLKPANMLRARFAVVTASLLAVGSFGSAGLLGCAAEEPPSSDGDVAMLEGELPQRVVFLGPIANGETKTGNHDDAPTLRAFAFEAQGGEEVVVDVKTEDGNALGWITTPQYRVLAFNDDAGPETHDARVTFRVPEGAPAQPLRIVFRDHEGLARPWELHLAIRKAAPLCAYGDATYEAGATFSAADGCNECACGEDGQVTCGTAACACDPATEPHRTYIATPKKCAVIRFDCPVGSLPFYNDCGCGCERPL